MSVFFSVAAIISRIGLPFYFAYTKRTVDLTLLNSSFDSFAWLAFLGIFLIYPLFVRARSPLILLSHATLLILMPAILIQSTIRLPLGAVNVFAFVLAVHYSPLNFGIPKRRAIGLSLATILGALLLIETIGSIVLLIHPLSAFAQNSAPLFFGVERMEFNLFYVADFAVVILVALLILSPILTTAAGWVLGNPSGVMNDSDWFRPRGIGLLVASLLGVSSLPGLVAFLPYFSRGSPVGVDASWYTSRLNELTSGGSPIDLMLHEPRAVYLLVLYGIHLAAGLSVSDTIKSGSILVSILFALGSYLFLKEATERRTIGILGAVLAGLSTQILVATLAAIFDAWLALAEMLLVFTLLLRSLKYPSARSTAGTVALSLLLMVTHVWTWAIFMVILTIDVLFSAPSRLSIRWSATKLTVLISSAAAGIALYALGYLSFSAFNSALNFGISWAFANLRPPSSFFSELKTTLINFAGGFFSNWLLAALALVGVFESRFLTREARILVLSWLSSMIIAVFLSSDVQWRLMFLIPYNILAAVGFFKLLWLVRERISGDEYMDRRLANFTQLCLAAVILLLLWNNAVRSMAFVAAHF